MTGKSFREIYGNSARAFIDDDVIMEQQEQLDKMVEIFRETFPRMKDFVPVRKPDTKEQWLKELEEYIHKMQAGERRSAHIYPDYEPGVFVQLLAGRGNGKSLMQEKLLEEQAHKISTTKPPSTVMPLTFAGFEPGVVHKDFWDGTIMKMSTEMSLKRSRQMGKDIMGIQDILDRIGK